MESDSAAFRKLIAGPRQYRIPPFQRSYSWEKPERETLWLDILTQYERLLPIIALPETEREERLKSIPTHYLGTIVLAGPTSLGVPKSDVIDGQQRLTTLLLALCALRDVRVRQLRREHASAPDLSELLDATRRRINNTFLINPDADPHERFRLLPLARDRKAFVACINHDGTTQLTPASLGLTDADSPRVLQAYQFFLTEFRRQHVDAERNPQLARFGSLFPLKLDVLQEAIASRLAFIMIETKNLDDVNAIFESLNATGRPLTQLDLLRNYIFMLLGGRAVDVLDEEWAPMERDHLRPAEVEQLIWADLVSRGRNILQNRTYRTVQALLRENAATSSAAEQYVKDLRRAAAYFEHLLRPGTESDPALSASLQRLNRAGGRTAYPVVLWLYQERHAGRCETAEIVDVVATLESFVARRFIAGLSPNNLNSMFGSMLVRIHADSGSARDRVERALLLNQKDWPTDDAVREAVKTNDFYTTGKTQQRVHILSALDKSYAPPGAVLSYEDSDQSIEHVLVQSDSTRWRADVAEAGGSFDDLQARYLHTLGNLTVVTPVENSALGDKAFVLKVPLYKTSAYPLTQQLAVSWDAETSGHRLWGEEAILARAADLAQRIIELWPRPTDAAGPGPVLPGDVIDSDAGETLIPFTSSIDETTDVQGATAVS